MKKNKILISVLVVILLAAVGAVAFLAIGGSKTAQTTEPSVYDSESADDSTASYAGSVFKNDKKTTKKTTTKKKTTKKTTQATTKDLYPFIRNGVWYLVDTKNEVCYAFDLKKNGKADVAYFNSENIEGFDAQYFKGDAKYTIKGKKIVFSKLPGGMGIKSVEFEIADKTLKYKGKKLKNYKNISLDNALKCFE